MMKVKLKRPYFGKLNASERFSRRFDRGDVVEFGEGMAIPKSAQAIDEVAKKTESEDSTSGAKKAPSK